MPQVITVPAQLFMNPHYDPFARTEAPDSTEEDAEWELALKKGFTKSANLNHLTIRPRPKVIADWAYQSDLGFIFAPRGLGKTWLGMYIAHSLATGNSIGPWKVYGQHNVLYIDGEMPPNDIQWRDHVLGEPTPNLTYINHEILFERTGKIMNLADYALQNAIIALCKHEAFTVLVLDNLSTLVSGIDENKTIDWERILPWLLRLRREHILVIFIHHAGRGGQMRGSSKREDPSAWIISLKEPTNDPEGETRGAHFISTFTKNRNAPERPKSIEWNFTPVDEAEILVRYELCQPLDVFRELVGAGVTQCTDIAEEMQVNAGYVSRLAKKAEAAGWLTIQGRKYSLKNQTFNPPFSQSNDP
jgi:RecA-family ATPase